MARSSFLGPNTGADLVFLGWPSFKFNKKEWTSELIRRARALRDQSVGSFILAVFNNLPIWSGAAKATLLPLSTLAKGVGFTVPPITPVAGSKKDSQHGISAGRQNATKKALNNVNDGYGFTWTHSIYHYWLNENFSLNYGPDKKVTPWKTLEDGAAAWQSFMLAHAHKALPSWTKYVVVIKTNFSLKMI